MVTELGASGKSAIDLLEPWRHHGALSCREELALEQADLSTKDVAEVPRYSAPDSLLNALLKDRPFPAMRHGSDTSKHSKASESHTSALTPPRPSSPRFTFSILESSPKPLDIRPEPLPSCRYGVKRRRYASDVDGFNTAVQSSKKRRLRSDLITSRLSQPYSQPATHILNREGQSAGDKRFLKMATSLDTARRVAHLHATSFLRFSVMNRLRKRLSQSFGQSGPHPKGHEKEAAAVAATPSFRAPWKPQNLMAAAVGRSLRFFPIPSGGISTGTGPLPAITTTPTRVDQPPANPKPGHQQAKPHACRLSKPAALPLPASDVAATQKRTSPRIHPVSSPELRPSGGSLDDLEEDSFAFLHPEDDDWDDGTDDPDNVYSDFSVIFGDGTPGAEAQDERTYEEYLDELDGICWVSR